MITILCGLMVVAGTGCKDKNAPENENNTAQGEQVQKRHLTIKMSDGAPRRIKDATIDDLGTTLYAEWQANDAVSCCNLSTLTGTKEIIITDDMRAASSGLRTDLEGEVECMADDYLAIVYPTVNMTQSYKMGDEIHCKFILPLANQDGSLVTLAKDFHHVYGRAHILSVSGSNAEAEMDKMQSLLTVCKFSFVEKNHEGNGALPINTLTISYGGSGSDAGKYPQTASVTVDVLTENGAANTVKEEDSTTPLTINAGGATEVYVALLPENAARVYNFTVTNGSGTYTGTAEALLKKGEFVVATNLKLVAN